MRKWFYRVVGLLCFMLNFAVYPVAAENLRSGGSGEKLYIANGCITCHGQAGNSPNPAMYPKIAGLERTYIIEQLNAFREGERANAMMSPMAMSLKSSDIAPLADYLAAQE